MTRLPPFGTATWQATLKFVWIVGGWFTGGENISVETAFTTKFTEPWPILGKKFMNNPTGVDLPAKEIISPTNTCPWTPSPVERVGEPETKTPVRDLRLCLRVPAAFGERIQALIPLALVATAVPKPNDSDSKAS